MKSRRDSKVVSTDDCIDACDSRVGPGLKGLSSQIANVMVAPTPDRIDVCDFRVGTMPTIQSHSPPDCAHQQSLMARSPSFHECVLS